MRIVYIHQYYRTRAMWGGTRSYEIARRLAAHGHEVHVVTTNAEAPRPSLRWRTSREEGVVVHRLSVPYSNYMLYRRRMWAFFGFALCASAKAVQLAPDVVFATSTPLTVAVPGVIGSRLRRVPFVFEVRDLWPELPIEMGALRNPLARALAFGLARLAYRNADRVIALSPGMAAGVAGYGYPPDRISVIPNGCDIDLFGVDDTMVHDFRSRHEWLQDRPLVLYAGTVGAINGVEYLLQLAAATRRLDPDVRFLVMGDGRELPSVKASAQRLDVLDRNLFFLPPVPKAEIPVILAAATVATSLFLPIPKMWDNSANKFFDALAAGRPVAINYGGWQAELLNDTGAGIVLDPDNVPAAAAELVARLRDARWLADAGRAARQLALTQFSRELLFMRLENVLRQAAGATPLSEESGAAGQVRKASGWPTATEPHEDTADQPDRRRRLSSGDLSK